MWSAPSASAVSSGKKIPKNNSGQLIPVRSYLFKLENNYLPWPSHPFFFDFLTFLFSDFPCFFLCVFLSFSKDLRGSAKNRNPCFFQGCPLLFPKKQGLEGQGWKLRFEQYLCNAFGRGGCKLQTSGMFLGLPSKSSRDTSQASPRPPNSFISERAKGAAKASCGETVVEKGVFGESVSSLPP